MINIKGRSAPTYLHEKTFPIFDISPQGNNALLIGRDSLTIPHNSKCPWRRRCEVVIFNAVQER